MNKSKDIICFDLETTGIDKSKDSIIQFAGIRINQETNKITKTLNLYIKPKGNYSISLAAYYVHGITAAFLDDKPTFEEVAPEIREFFAGDVDILGYNACSFDLSFLAIEFERIGQEFTLMDHDIYDAFYEEKRRNGNTLGDTFKRYYGMTMEEKGLKAHDALSDVKATYMVYVAQQKQKEYGPEEILTEDNIINLQEFKGELKPCFTVGKYRAIPLSIVYDLDRGYLDWILSDRCKFSPSTKKYVNDFITEKR